MLNVFKLIVIFGVIDHRMILAIGGLCNRLLNFAFLRDKIRLY